MNQHQPYAAPQSNVAGPSGHAQGIPEEVIHHLTRTGPWVRLISTMFYISIFFIVIGALGMLGGASAMSSEMDMPEAVVFGMAAMYLVSAVLTFVMALYLGRYGKSIRSLSTTRGVPDLVDALSAQASFWKFVGVLTASYLGLAVLGIIAAIAIPVFLAAQ